MTIRRYKNALSAAVVRTIMIPGTYSDGNGLTLRVEASGTKHWVQRVTVGGRRRNIGLGSFLPFRWPMPGNSPLQTSGSSARVGTRSWRSVGPQRSSEGRRYRRSPKPRSAS